MTDKQAKEEKILDARDGIDTSIRNLRIDRVLFSVFECLLQQNLPFSLNERDQYTFFLRANENFEKHLIELHAAWKELEQLQDEA